MREIQFPSRLDFAQLPTPITPLDRLGARWGGPRLWVKRDDDTGGVITGNKIRKLQYAVREALDQGADTLVTCGGVQSNHCRATCVVARRVGLDPVLCLRGTPPTTSTGNHLLDQVLGATIEYCTPEEYKAHDDVMDRVADRLRSEGRKPYVVAEGASMAIATWGYIEACQEIAQAQRRLGVEFDAIVTATGSGGTNAGLELGVRLFDLRARVFGINVCDDEDYFRALIHRIADEAITKFSLPVELSAADIGLIDGYVGRGYAQSTEDELEFLVDVARTEGLVLDPVYTGKALFGLRSELGGPRFEGMRNVLFVHTGGVFGLFPKADEIPL